MSITQGILRKVMLFLDMIKFPHTLFALPFAFMGAFLAEKGIPSSNKLFWLLMAMVGARSGAMAFNRWADQALDAKNPRTQGWALPKGLVSPGEVKVFIILSFALLAFSAYQLNPLAFKLSPLAIAIVTLYSFTKRFTSLSHLFLGLCLSLAPLVAWIAIKGRIDFLPFPLGLAVLFWVAGFDILYSLQDMDFDRRMGLYSLPSRWGLNRSLIIARLFHLITVLLLTSLIPIMGLGTIYAGGLLLGVSLLTYEHYLLYRHGLGRLDVAFFNVNGAFSLILLFFTLLDLLIPVPIHPALTTRPF